MALSSIGRFVVAGMVAGTVAAMEAIEGQAAAQTAPPNLIVIFADDLGYGDIGAFGAPNARTPHLDRMAAEGQKWTSFYVQPVCSPSRAALLTGRLPVRSGMYGLPTGVAPRVLRDNAAEGLPSSEITVAALLRRAGYRTGMVGKWHLGHLPQFLPSQHGFDTWFGIPFSHDMRMTVPRDSGYQTRAYYDPKPSYWDVPLLRDDREIERPVDHRTMTRRFTEEAEAFISTHRQQPFFLYVAHAMPHIPLAASSGFAGRSPGGRYGDVIEELDWSVGRILGAVRAAGLEQRTVVVFTSDNGPWLPFGHHAGSAGPFRGGKGTTWEGGVRAPTIFWGPGIVAPGVITDMGGGLDLLPTAAALAGVSVPADRPLDGVDLLPVLRHRAAGARQTHFYYWDNELRAIRHGRFKAHFITSGAYDVSTNRVVHGTPLLYDLAEDPGERYDIAARHPDVVAELQRMAHVHRQSMTMGPPLFDRVLPTGAGRPR